jgi:divalent anion:Na+ symporter, DASS family
LGGIILPVALSVSETYDSRLDDGTAGRLGTFLMNLLYQCEVILCATFQTGQASNVIIAKFVQQNANEILLQKIMGKSAKSANLPTE